MLRRLMLASLLMLTLAACGDPTNQPPQREIPTQISGNIGIADAGGTFVYAAGTTLLDDNILFTSTIDDNGAFSFDLTDPPFLLTYYGCDDEPFTAAIVFGAWIAWDGIPTGDADDTPRQFTAAALIATESPLVSVVWVYSPASQTILTGCESGTPTPFQLPAGWSIMTVDFTTGFWALLPRIPTSAFWRPNTFCLPTCPATAGTSKLD